MLPGEALSLHFQVLQFEQANKVQQKKKKFQANNELQASWLKCSFVEVSDLLRQRT